jgi:hypothetical protein
MMTACATGKECPDYGEHLRLVIRRIEYLERANSRLKWISAAVSSGLIALLLGAAQRNPEPGTVKAQQFVLINSEGKCHATLSLDPFEGLPQLSLYDTDGNPVAELNGHALTFVRAGQKGAAQECYFGTDGTGNGRVSFTDDRGIRRCSLGIADSHAPYLKIFDRSALERVGMTLDPQSNDAPELHIADEKGRDGCSLGITENRVPYLKFWDQSNRVRMGMVLNPETNDAPNMHVMDVRQSIRAGISMDLADKPALYIQHANLKPAIELGTRPDSSVGLSFYRDDGLERVDLHLGNDGVPDLTLSGKDGNPIFRAP